VTGPVRTAGGGPPLRALFYLKVMGMNEKRPDVCAYCNLLRTNKLQYALDPEEQCPGAEEAMFKQLGRGQA